MASSLSDVANNLCKGIYKTNWCKCGHGDKKSIATVFLNTQSLKMI